MVLVLTACPPKLRGSLTRWLMEISAGVYVGSVSRRVREMLWLRVAEEMHTGRAIMVHSARNEQKLEFKVHGHDWHPVDFDGLMLMMRPSPEQTQKGAPTTPGGRPSTGWSKAARRRKYGSRGGNRV